MTKSILFTQATPDQRLKHAVQQILKPGSPYRNQAMVEAITCVRNVSGETFRVVRESLRSKLPCSEAPFFYKLCAAGGHKELPYFSEKRNPNINLNGQVAMHDAPKQQIVCRHLVLLWEKLFMKLSGKVDYKQLSTSEALQENISWKMDTDFLRRRMSSACHLTENQGWGRVIADTFREMDNKQATCQTLMITTGKHALCLGLRIRPTTNGKVRYSVKLYDPNNTTAHLRACNDLDGIEKLRADDFFISASMNLYNMPPEGTVVFFGESVDTSANPNRCLSMPKGPPHPLTVYHLLTLNLAGHLSELLGRPDVTQQNIYQLLEAKDGNGFPGLTSACQKGNAEVILDYGERVRNSDLSKDQQFRLLEARSSMKRSSPVGVAYTEVVSKSRLSQEQQFILMHAVIPDCPPPPPSCPPPPPPIRSADTDGRKNLSGG